MPQESNVLSGTSIPLSAKNRLRTWATIRHLLFPFALQFNSSSCMILVILLGLTGQSIMAADVAVVHGATLALYLSFAANARSIVLNSNSAAAFNLLVRARLLLVLPLAVGSLLLATLFSNILLVLALAVILRRSVESFVELVISEAERLQMPTIALRSIVVDLVGLVSVVGSFVAGPLWSAITLFIWATLPALTSWSMVQSSLAHAKANVWSRSLIPHIGSSLVIGVSTYVFRVLIVLLVGKEIGGNLFGAFSIGSMAGTAFSTGIGPTLLLRKRIGTISSNQVVVLASGCLATLGLAVFGVVTGLGISGETVRQQFWLATGFSLLGGSLMVPAQYYRLKQLQESPAENVFPADVLTSVLAVAVLPFLYLVSKDEFLVAAYFVNGVIALLIYWQMSHRRATIILGTWVESKALAITYSLFLLPVFVQAESGIFRDPAFLFDSGGSIMRLPIPISVAACGLGYVFLVGLHHARFSLCVMFFAFMSLVMAAMASTIEQPTNQPGKLILAMQFLLPMFAMPLGQLAGRGEVSGRLMARSFLYILVLVVPAQLAATWLQGDIYLQPYLGLFSVYQHLQYVPMVFVSAFILCLFLLWDNVTRVTLQHIILTLGGPTMGIYVVLSGSLASSMSLIAGLLLHAVVRRKTVLSNWAITSAVATIVILFSSLWFENHMHLKFQMHVKSQGAGKGPAGLVMPDNMQERLTIWRHYTEGALQSTATLVAGSPNMPDRSVYPSAHNYFLDLLYNFGLLGLAPITMALLLTLKQIIQKWPVIFQSLELQALVGVVMLLVVADNCFKVGLRQPYPGLFSFFLWGVLLAKLQVETVASGPSPREAN